MHRRTKTALPERLIEMNVVRMLTAGFVAVAMTGCGVLKGPEPWEKGNLAKPAMQMGGDLEQRVSQQIYHAKEAPSGGWGVGGGGCGCN